MYGLIFLFKWSGETDTSSDMDPAQVPNVYFANQVRAGDRGRH